jgi:hypothetical protein
LVAIKGEDMYYITEEKTSEHWLDCNLKDGIVRWESNNKVPPNDIVEALSKYGLITSEEAELSKSTHEKEIDYKFLERYMKSIDEKMIFEAIM